MKKMLIITQLDLERMHNTVEEQHARGYLRAGHEVTYLYKELNESRALRDLLRDTFLPRYSRRPDPAATPSDDHEPQRDSDDCNANGPVRTDLNPGNMPSRTGARALHCYRMNPPFNYYSGYRANAEAGESGASRRSSLRLRLIRALSPLSCLRDVFFVPAMLVAALLIRPAAWDVCIGYGPWGGLVAWMLKKVGKARHMVYQDRDYEPGLVPYHLRARYTAAVENFCIRRADLICSVGYMLAERRRQETGREVHVVPNGVDWHRFADAREAGSFGETLVYVGNLIDWGGLEHAIEALSLMRDERPRLRLVLIGDGLPAYVDTLRALAEARGVSDRVEFLGRQRPEALPALIGRGSIGLANSKPVPFRMYACPLKIMEYMAAGLPAISTSNTEGAAILARHACGVAVEFDPQSLAEGICYLLDDEERWQRLRRNGIDASGTLTWNHVVHHELSLVDALTVT